MVDRGEKLVNFNIFFFLNLILSRPDTSRAWHLQPILFCFFGPCLCRMYTFILSPVPEAPSLPNLLSHLSSPSLTQRLAEVQLFFSPGWPLCISWVTTAIILKNGSLRSSPAAHGFWNFLSSSTFFAAAVPSRARLWALSLTFYSRE